MTARNLERPIWGPQEAAGYLGTSASSALEILTQRGVSPIVKRGTENRQWIRWCKADVIRAFAESPITNGNGHAKAEAPAAKVAAPVEVRANRAHLTCTDSEHERVKQFAKAHDISISDLVRTAVFTFINEAKNA